MKEVDVLLINPPFHSRSGSSKIFPLGLGYVISSVNKSGFSYEVIDCTQIISSYYEDELHLLKEKLSEKLKEYKPLIVGIGPCITTQVKALKIISDCCKDNYDINTVFAGGPLASIEGQEWFFYDYLGINYIVKGDGEYAVANAISYIKKGKKLSDCPNISHSSYSFYNFISDIDLISFPTRLYIDDTSISIRRQSDDFTRKVASMITSRGCPYSCSYCVSGNLPYKNFRKRSNQNIIDEVKLLNEKYSVDDIIFYDDCFFYNPKQVNIDIENFCNILVKATTDITWQIELRVDVIMQMNLESILLLEKSGCRQINLGIEKSNNLSLKMLEKNISLNDLSHKIDMIKNNTKIKLAGTFILGGKNEKESDVLDIIRYAKSLKLDFAHFSPLFIYPGTPLYKDFFNNDREWVDYLINDSLPWGEIVFENKYINKERLIELAESAYFEFYKNTPYYESMMVNDRFNLRGRPNI